MSARGDLGMLTPGAQRLVSAAHAAWLRDACEALGAWHWASALLAEQPRLVTALAPSADPEALSRDWSAARARGESGPPLSVPAAVEQALAAAGEHQSEVASAADLATVVLTAAGVACTPDPTALRSALNAIGPEETDTAGPPPSAEDAVRKVRARRASRDGGSLLAHFGHDLTHAAEQGLLNPVLGRESEIKLVIETLCRRTKRNPALIGPAGVGKTAIAEGLAQRIVRGEVPAPLRQRKVVALPASSLVAGAGVVGELEQRMEKLLAEVARQDVILFIDELHTIVGAGSSSTHRSGDVANMLKPGLARGDFACIAATTDDEYRRYIEPDSALERRFQPIRIQEMDAAQTLAILQSLRASFARSHGVETGDPVLTWLIDFAARFMHNRFFPDKAIDLLEQCVANAVSEGRRQVELADAETVAQRMIGMPLDLDARLAALSGALSARGLLPEPDIAALRARLDVTLRGLDLRPNRPNATLLLLGEAAGAGEAVSTAIGETLYGSPERVVTIDLSPYLEPSHVSMLLGSGPGYVGYQDALPLHKVAQMPWCVLRLDHVDLCHPAVREVLKQGLTDGFLTLGDGRRLYLSDAVVCLTAGFSPEGRRVAGFRNVNPMLSESSARSLAAKTLGEALLEEVDVISTGVLRSENQRRRWLAEQLLPELGRRYHERRVNVSWDDAVLDWLLNRHTSAADVRDWERWIENQLAPLLIPHLPASDQGEVNLRLVLGKEGAPEALVLANRKDVAQASRL